MISDSGERVLRHVSGPYNLNTYAVWCGDTRETVIIDPGGRAEDLIHLIREKRLVPSRILNTHGHTDPDFSMPVFKARFPVPSCLHEADDDFFKDPTVREKTRRAIGLRHPWPVEVRLRDNDRIRFGNTFIKVIHTPGHTPGSVCFLWEGHLFSGDAVFVGEAGRTDLPGGSLHDLIESIRIRILSLEPATVIHPGHHHSGEAFESTLEREMRENIYIRDFILDP